MATETVVKKETKNKISVDFEGKLTFKERLKQKLKTYVVIGLEHSPGDVSLRLDLREGF